MISQHIAILGAVLPLAGFASYARDTLRGRAQPDRVSWALWAAAPLIAFAAEVAQHTSVQVALVTLTLGAGPLCVLLASLAARGANWRLTRLDIACGGLSALALAAWLVTGRGDAAIALAIAADALAAAPTITKSWTSPRSESPWTYLASGAGAGITLAAVPHRTFAACGFPAYAAAVCTVIAALILVPRPVLRGAGLALGWGTAVSGIALPVVMVAGILSAPAPPALPASGPPLASLPDHARPALAASSRRPGVHRHRRHRHRAGSALLPLPGSPAPVTTRPSPPKPSPSRPRSPYPSPAATEPYPSTTSATPSPARTGTPSPSPSPYPSSSSPSPSPGPYASTTPTLAYGG